MSCEGCNGKRCRGCYDFSNHSSHDPAVPLGLAAVAILVLALLAFLYGCDRAHSQTHHDLDHMQGHAQFHDTYKTWKQPNGVSCCNDEDCAPIDAKDVRITASKVEVNIPHIVGGPKEWTLVPPERIRPYSSPDLGSHVCHLYGDVLCFVYGGGM